MTKENCKMTCCKVSLFLAGLAVGVILTFAVAYFLKADFTQTSTFKFLPKLSTQTTTTTVQPSTTLNTSTSTINTVQTKSLPDLPGL